MVAVNGSSNCNPRWKNMAERQLSCESLSAGLAMVQQMAGGVSSEELASKIEVLYLHHPS